jgi:hypothetical protein
VGLHHVCILVGFFFVLLTMFDVKSFLVGVLFAVVIMVPTIYQLIATTARDYAKHVEIGNYIQHVQPKAKSGEDIPSVCLPCKICSNSNISTRKDNDELCIPDAKIKREIWPIADVAVQNFDSEFLRCTVSTPATRQQGLRKTLSVWIDTFVLGQQVGGKLCSIPKGLDAGVCVRNEVLGQHKTVFEYRCLPSFILIGAQKAGTRELMNYLEAHPRLSAPSNEVAYLHKDIPQYQDDIGGWWRRYLKLLPTMKYQQLNTVHVFEKTPEYMIMSKHQIERVKIVMPSLKFIMQLRDPVSRAYSWFNMKCRVKAQMRIVEDGPEKGDVLYFSSTQAAVAYPYNTSDADCTPMMFQHLMLDRTSNEPK